ncbi:hypothetical protein DL765_003343 [Monosporascus sp. GIB2]|nr:hypothetical protein DL765_003343 [Monosporascus sp. GIB2]
MAASSGKAMSVVNSNAIEMQAAGHDSGAGRTGGTLTVGPRPVEHLLVARRGRKGTFLQQIDIRTNERGSDVMGLLKEKLPARNIFSTVLLREQVEVGQIDRVPHFASSHVGVQVFPSGCSIDHRLSCALANPSVLDNDAESGGGGSFAAAYPQLLASSESHKVLIVSSRLRGEVKLGFLVLAVLVAITPGLAMGFASHNIGWGAACTGAGVAIVGIFVTVFWKREAYAVGRMT